MSELLTFPLSSHSMRISVSLNKADVRLNHRSLIPNPESLRVLESFQRTFLERLSIGELHVLLVIILGILGSFLMVASDETHDTRVIAVDKSQFMSFQRAIVDLELSFLPDISTCSGDICDSCSNQHVEATVRIFPQSGVFLCNVLDHVESPNDQKGWNIAAYHKEALLL
jgi:hypothetical protein